MKTTISEADAFELTTQQKSEISNKFSILEEEKKFLVSEYNRIIAQELTPELSAEAKVLDSKMQKHLKSKKDIHRANKAFFLNGGRFVDSIYNVEKVEFDLMRESTQKIKNYAENLEKARVAKIQAERVILLSEFMDGAEDRDLGNMEDDLWEALLAAKEQAHLDFLQAEVDAEKARQKQLKAEQDEQKRVRKENLKLRAEAEERDQLLLKTQAEHTAKIKAAQDAEAKKERERKALEDKLATELANKLAAELKVKEDAEKKVQDELNKGDKAKIQDLIDDLIALKTKYAFKAVKTQKMYDRVGHLIDKVITLM